MKWMLLLDDIRDVQIPRAYLYVQGPYFQGKKQVPEHLPWSAGMPVSIERSSKRKIVIVIQGDYSQV
jgi:hypothetical protein